MADTAVVTDDATATAAAAAALADTTTTTDATASAATTADSAAASAAASSGASVVPESYDLKLPDGSTVDPAIVERTAAIARELGLSNEAGQKLLDQTVQDLTERTTAAEAKATADRQAFVEAWKPGGAEWVKRNEAWTKQAQADPDLGGTPEQFTATLEKAQQALAKYAPADLKPLLDETGFGSHPAVIKMLASIGRAMSEGALVTGGVGGGKPKSDAETLYPNHYTDGAPKP